MKTIFGVAAAAAAATAAVLLVARRRRRSRDQRLRWNEKIGKRKIRAVIFDKDGTLIEFGKMWTKWILDVVDGIETVAKADREHIDGNALKRAIFEKIGFDPEENRVVGDGAFACGTMEELREMTKETTLKMTEMSERKLDEALDVLWTTPDPVKLAFQRADLAKLFTELKRRGLFVAVCTTDDIDPTMQTLRAFGVADLAQVVLGGDMGVRPKPSVDQIRYICDKIGHGLEPEACVMVGDTPRDMRMGRAANCALCIGVCGGAAEPEALGEAHVIVPRLDAVLSVLSAVGV